MKTWIYFFLFLPLSLFALKKRVELVHDEPVRYWVQEAEKALAENNLEVVQTRLKGVLKPDDVGYYVFWNKPHVASRKRLLQIPKNKAVLFMWEPPTVQKKLYSRKYLRHFKRIYTWNDDLVDNKRFFKLYYPELKPMLSTLPSFAEKKLCTSISANKTSKHASELYSEREKAIQFFEDKPAGEFEFYGQRWESKGYKNYRGAPANKFEVMKNYRFSICYENTRDVRGYVTEKIFDSFASGCVPVYWGASNVTDYIPENCFIDRRKFQDNEELYAFLRGMDEKTYNDYLDNIRGFLQSDKAQLFSQNMFTTIFLDAVRFP